MPGERATLAILHPGEMGARVGQILRARGHRVTQRFADAGLPPAPPGSHGAWRLPELIETLRAVRPRGDGAAPLPEPRGREADGLAATR